MKPIGFPRVDGWPKSGRARERRRTERIVREQFDPDWNEPCANGQCEVCFGPPDGTMAAIYEAIDTWHEADSRLSLPEWLGWSDEEYRAFLERFC